MRTPDLEALQRRDPDAWDVAFSWLWPAAFGAAWAVLERYLPADAEDVTIAAIEDPVEKVPGLKSTDELKPLVVSIAHHKAESRLREHFSDKRGGGQVENPDELPEVADPDSLLAKVETDELAERLRRLLAQLKPLCREMLTEVFLSGSTHNDVAKKHGFGPKSVGIRVSRCLGALRRLWGPE